MSATRERDNTIAVITGAWKHTPHKAFSLWDMIQFEANDLASHLTSLLEWKAQCDEAAKKCATSEADERTKMVVLKWVEEIKSICGRIGLLQSEDRCLWFSNHLIGLTGMTVITNQFLACEIDAMASTLCFELQNHKFAYIPVTVSEYFEREDLFGVAFHNGASHEVNTEIKAAGNCLAAELNTAAVFHLMRVVEIGLQKLVQHMISAGIPVTITRQVEFATWGQLINAIDDKLKNLKATQATPAREVELQFYSTILQEIRAFQYAWRDPVMHARFEEPHEAENLFRHVKRFMQELATRVSLA